MPNDFLIVSEEDLGTRLDKLLATHFPNYSRTYFQALIKEKLVLVNQALVKKSTKLAVGDEIEVEFSLTPELSVGPEPIPLDILYEDAYLLAVNKPAGMVVHPAVGNWTGTFVNALLYHCSQIASQGSLRPGIVHRLDKDTSGVLLAAKDEITQRKLVELFANRQIYKEYLAICLGHPGHQEIVANIGRHPARRKEMSVVKDGGKEAKTECEILCFDQTLSYIKLIPHTGRTHQLRVHLHYIGTPILGDMVYGRAAANKKYATARQLLHAHILRFIHPITKEEIELKAPIPQDISKFIELISKYADLNPKS